MVRRAVCLFRCTPGFLVVCTVDGRCVEMAGSAAAIWDALPEPTAPPVPVVEIVNRLAVEHVMPAPVVNADVAAVIGSLVEVGCATVAG